MKRPLIPTPTELLWMLLGLFLTIWGTLLQLNLGTYILTFQVAGLILTGYLAGGRAACGSQVLYIAMGLAGYDVFNQGGGLSYIHNPAFGYLLGFVPGAWLCGSLADRVAPRQFIGLLIAGVTGITAVHLTGIMFLSFSGNLGSAVSLYSLYPLPGQLLVVTLCVVVGSIMRRLLLID